MSYNNSLVGEQVAVPLSMNNGVLDIVVENAAVQNFITNGTSPNNNDDTEYQAQIMGGTRLVTGLGPNMLTYITNYMTNVFAAHTGTPFIYINGHVQRVQCSVGTNALDFEETFGTSEFPPSGSGFVTGEPQAGNYTSYFSTWVFKAPLTIAVPDSTSASGVRYLTFTTLFDGD